MRQSYNMAGVSYEDDVSNSGYPAPAPTYPAPNQQSNQPPEPQQEPSSKTYGLGLRKGGSVKKYKSGGKVSSASTRGDGCAVRGKTKGRMV